MATRFYLPASGNPPLASLNFQADWERSTGFARLPCFTTKQNTALATSARTWAGTTTVQWVWWQFQSDVLSAAYNWTTADTVSMVLGKLAETTTAGDTHLAYIIKVVSGDGATVRGVIGLVHATSTEYALVASAATRIHAASVTGATNFSSQIGDRIIIEIGVHGVTPAAESIQMRIGDPSATADFALTAALTTDLCSWVELSRSVEFGAPPPAAYTMSCTKGSIAMTGLAVGLLLGHTLTVSAGTFNETGNSVNFKSGHTLSATKGTFNETDNSIGLYKGKTLVLSAGSFAETGNAVNLIKGRIIVASKGTFNETGKDVTFKSARSIVTELGTFTEIGNNVLLKIGRAISVSTGSFELTGNQTNINISRKLIADIGTFNEYGNAVNFRIGKVINVEAGEFNITGNPVDLILSGETPLPQNLIITVSPGEFNLTGRDAGLKTGRNIITEIGIFNELGNDINFKIGRSIVLTAGTFELQGKDVVFVLHESNKIIHVETGEFTIIGNTVNLVVVLIKKDTAVYTNFRILIPHRKDNDIIGGICKDGSIYCRPDIEKLRIPWDDVKYITRKSSSQRRYYNCIICGYKLSRKRNKHKIERYVDRS